MLEQLIFSRYRPDKRILFVGINHQTEHYKREFFSRHDLLMIDSDRSKARYAGGAPFIHTSLEGFSTLSGFDAIICNGVLNFGLDDRHVAERAMLVCHMILNVHGELVLGWHDTAPPEVRVRPQDIKALERFEHIAHYRVPGTTNGHTFDIYRY